MTKHIRSAAFRGVTVAGIRADAADPNKVLAAIQAAFSDFKASQEEELKNVKAKFDDVVTKEKTERINAELGKLQSAMDAINTKLAANAAGPSGARQIPDAEYSAAFAAHVRKGDVNASLNKGTASEGGYTTPVEWDRTIQNEMKLVSPVRQLVNVKPIGVHAASKLVNRRGAASGWVGETAARTETAGPALASFNIGWGEIYANPAATQQLLDDALIDIESWLADELSLEFAYQEGVAVISGNGTNKPKGLLNYVTGGSLASDHPSGAIAITVSGNAATLMSDGIVNLVHALPSKYAGNASFAMNRNVHGKIRLLKDGQGNYLWQPSYAAGQPATLSGYPLVEVPDMPSVAANAFPILFGDFKRAYTLYDRFGVRTLRDPYTNKPYVMFYTTKRVGGALDDPKALVAQKISV